MSHTSAAEELGPKGLEPLFSFLSPSAAAHGLLAGHLRTAEVSAGDAAVCAEGSRSVKHLEQ